jgi:hypothetical protein
LGTLTGKEQSNLGHEFSFAQPNSG